MKRTLVFVFPLLVLCLSAGAADDIKLDVREHTLDNGLRILMIIF